MLVSLVIVRQNPTINLQFSAPNWKLFVSQGDETVGIQPGDEVLSVNGKYQPMASDAETAMKNGVVSLLCRVPDGNPRLMQTTVFKQKDSHIGLSVQSDDTAMVVHKADGMMKFSGIKPGTSVLFINKSPVRDIDLASKLVYESDTICMVTDPSNASAGAVSVLCCGSKKNGPVIPM